MPRQSASQETHERPHSRVYREKYRRTYGTGPYTCYFCAAELLALEIVHHVDEDPWNNDIENLVAAHTVCHNQHHHWDVVMTAESNARRRKTFLKTMESLTTEERQARYAQPGKLNSFYGKKHTDETRERIAKKAKERPRVCCLHCRREMSVNSFARHCGSRSCAKSAE